MSKVGSVTDRFGYGPLIVPPLLLITVLSLGFVFMESHMIAQKHAVPASAAPKPTKVTDSTQSSQLADAAFQKFDTLQQLPTPTTTETPASSTSVQTATPQSSPTETSQSLQSATQNSQTKSSTSSVQNIITQLNNSLKVKNSSKQKLNF